MVLNNAKPQLFIHRPDGLKISGHQQLIANSSVNGQEAKRINGEPGTAPDATSNKTAEPGKESLAEFPGGAEAFLAYLEKNLVVPMRVNGTANRQVVISFEIDAQGSCSEVLLLSAEGIEEEINKVMTTMPKWKPAFRNGRFIATRITQPVNF